MVRTLPRRLLLGGLLALASGCSLGGSPFEGTWLFKIDLELDDIEGSCVNDDATFEEEGFYYQWVDIHSPGKDQLVVLLDDILTGTATGKTFTVGVDEAVEYTGYVLEESTSVTGTLAGGILSGTISSIEELAQGNDVSSYEYDCEATWAYTAERSVSHTERYEEVEE
jgi:hypothetical protein